MVSLFSKSANVHISWYEYHKNPIDLKTYKVVQLKQISKINCLYVSGTKSVLIERIDKHFKLINSVAIIQAWVR